MKDAKLWKRILNEGLYSGDRADGHHDERRIISSPIITFGPQDWIDGTSVDLNEWVGQSIAMPFDRFWVEAGPMPDSDFRCGAFFGSADGKPHHDGILARIVTVCADRSSPPYMIAEMRLRFSYARILQSVVVTDDLHPRPGNEMLNREVFSHAMNALILMSCKNVSLSPRDNDPKEVRRATKRHGPNPHGYRYHVLTVRPAGSKPGTPGVEIGTMPRHVCRGHFSEYGPEFGKGLLFGKYAGRFFIPPHLKGKTENGIVEKDYRVQA